MAEPPSNEVDVRFPWKRCSGCGEMMLFLRTEAGRWSPVTCDAEGVFPETDEIFDPEEHSSHFASCPNADRFRGRRGRRGDGA